MLLVVFDQAAPKLLRTMLKHKVVASAPAKLILHGEQTVVLGRTAIATALDLRTYAIIEPAASDLTINLPDLKTSKSWSLSDVQYSGTTQF